MHDDHQILIFYQSRIVVSPEPLFTLVSFDMSSAAPRKVFFSRNVPYAIGESLNSMTAK